MTNGNPGFSSFVIRHSSFNSMDPTLTLAKLLLIAWLLPLASFTVIVIGYTIPLMLGLRVRYETQKFAGYIAIVAIVAAFVLSATAMFGYWLPDHPLKAAAHESESAVAAEEHAAEGEAEQHEAGHTNGPPPAISGVLYNLGTWGNLELPISYYIDTLTVTMFCMVTLIASCIHIYAFGYMHDELHDYVDHEVKLDDGRHLHRRGRFHRFFQYFSLFSFSMLGICIAGNLAMVFVFWELVGICSYFLIGFYIERHSATTAANKAFIVNRVGDFGMLISMMALWSSLGTFSFGDTTTADGSTKPGIFSLLHTEENGHRLAPADGMIAAEAQNQIAEAVRRAGSTDPAAINAAIAAEVARLRADQSTPWGYKLLCIAGVGIFCGCVGKSAQFPLHTWLPDAMEGPTPVSALVHSATMVAAGVYLVGRVYPIFTPEALLVIAAIGCVTLFLAATIAVTAVDIKRVLAYSTVSQLGFMMLALGLGGWVAGLFHLITHAFFKSLLFLCSGSVIHAVHTNDMRQMGGLRHKMPITAYTMLIGCLAIAGVGIPFIPWLPQLSGVGLSGFHSKDVIVEQALHFARTNDDTRPWTWVFVIVPLFGALLTSFYMFRLWYMTFAGKPRDHHRYDHAHESPRVMTAPLVVLAFFAICSGWTLRYAPGVLANFGVENLLDTARPVGMLGDKPGVLIANLVVPDEHAAHVNDVKIPAGLSAIFVALAGIGGATVVYLWETVSATSLRRWLNWAYHITWNKWWFDELYDFLFVRPTLAAANFLAYTLDRGLIDGIVHAFAALYRVLSLVVAYFGDQFLIDGTVDNFAERTWNLGLSMRAVQTGRLRQYVMFIVVGTIVFFVVASLWWRYAVAG
jgi:NADH-quinone oxidoreductase subunit L